MRCKDRSFYVWGVKVLPHNAEVLIDGVWRPVTLKRATPGSDAVCLHELTERLPIRIKDVGVLELDPARCFGRQGRRVDVEALSLRLPGDKRRRYLEAIAHTATEPSALVAVLLNPSTRYFGYKTAAARLNAAARERLLLAHFAAREEDETTTRRRRLTNDALDALFAHLVSHRPSPHRDALIERLAHEYIKQDSYPTRVTKIIGSPRLRPDTRELVLSLFVDRYPAAVLEHTPADGVWLERALRGVLTESRDRGFAASISHLFLGFERLAASDVHRIVTAARDDLTLSNPTALVAALAAHLHDPAMRTLCASFPSATDLLEAAESLAGDRHLFDPAPAFSGWGSVTRRLSPDRAPDCLGYLFPEEAAAFDPSRISLAGPQECSSTIDRFVSTGARPSQVDEYAVLVWSHALAAGTAGTGEENDWRYLTARLANMAPSASLAALGGSTELARMRRARLVAGCDTREVLEVFALHDTGRPAVTALRKLDDPALWRTVAARHAPAAEAAPLEVLASIDPADADAKVRAVMVYRKLIDPLTAVSDPDYRVRIAAARVSPAAAAALVRDEIYIVAQQAIAHVDDPEVLAGVADSWDLAPRRYQELLWFELATATDDPELARVAASRLTNPRLLARLSKDPELHRTVTDRMVSYPRGSWSPLVGEHEDHGPEPF